MNVETMSEEEFQAFFAWLPERVKLLVRGRMVDWREVLPEWLKKYEAEKADAVSA
jgi:hypothetical protein